MKNVILYISLFILVSLCGCLMPSYISINYQNDNPLDDFKYTATNTYGFDIKNSTASITINDSIIDLTEGYTSPHSGFIPVNSTKKGQLIPVTFTINSEINSTNRTISCTEYIPGKLKPNGEYILLFDTYYYYSSSNIINFSYLYLYPYLYK